VLGRLLGIGPQDTVVVPLRLTFIFGLWASLLALRVGARLVLVPRFTADGMAKTLGEGATVLAAVPTMLRGLLAENVPAPTLRLILTGGESLGTALGAQLQSALPGTGVFDLYGLTETGSCDFCLPPADHAAAAGCIGRPTEGVSFRILREDGSSAGPGERGELCIATPFGMLGYLDDPGLTANSFADGYFRTGDLAQVRPDGLVEIVGRLKDIVSRGGNKIAPAEIDALLASHPDVAAALCAGVPDGRLGEALHAAVVLTPGATTSPEALRQWLAGRIERFKVPDAIHVCDVLPVGATGKTRRAGVVEIARAREDQSRGQPPSER
jgi:acyl-CoA synthetase (AMP-forming)/AMP-acid ligase II